MRPSPLMLVYTVILCIGCARADVLFDSGPPGTNTGGPVSDFHTPSQVAASFAVPNNSLATKLNWAGIYAPTDTPQDDNFTIRLFADIGGTPAMSPIFQRNIGDGSRVDTGLVDVPTASSGPFHIYSYSAILSSPLPLDGGTQFWLSIVNNTSNDADDSWHWKRTEIFGGTTWLRGDDAAVWRPGGGVLSFSLEGTAPIPEPSTVLLLALSSALLLLGRRNGRFRAGTVAAF